MTLLNQDGTEFIVQYWTLCGLTPPKGEELITGQKNMANALLCGQKIPRTQDKTLAPMYGARMDILHQR